MSIQRRNHQRGAQGVDQQVLRPPESNVGARGCRKDLLKAGVDGFVHVVRDRDVDDEYLALVKSHPKVWTGPISCPGRDGT